MHIMEYVKCAVNVRAHFNCARAINAQESQLCSVKAKSTKIEVTNLKSIDR